MRTRQAHRYVMAFVLASVLLAAPAPAQDAEETRTGESGPLGFITMPFQAVVEEGPAEIVPDVLVNVSEVRESGGRHVLVTFAEGCDPTDAGPECIGNGTSPQALNVTLVETRVPANATPVSPSRIENETGRVKIWFDVFDLPDDARIRFQPVLEVGAARAGLYRLEGLVLVMDRNYVNVEADRGVPLQLFAFTNVGVNEPTVVTPTPTPSPTPTPGPTPEEAQPGPIPAPGIVAAALALAGVAVLVARRRR